MSWDTTAAEPWRWTKNDPELHTPVIVADGGPWAKHDQACAVCQTKPAVLDLDSGIFHPCWSCQHEGWKLAQSRRRRR